MVIKVACGRSIEVQVPDLAKNIRRRRVNKHWSQERLAAEIGRTQGAISSVERGETEEPGSIAAIAAALDTTVEELMKPWNPAEGAIDEVIRADVTKISPVKLAQLQAVQALKHHGEIWQVATDLMDGFAPRWAYIIADVGAPHTDVDLVLAKRMSPKGETVMLFRLLLSGKLLYVSDRGIRGSDSVTDSHITIYATVDRETKV